MSSAILYVAIVVIWACVLIPRWLHRGQASEAAGEFSDDSSEPAPQDSPAQEDADSMTSGSASTAKPMPASAAEEAPADGSGPRRAPRNRAEARRKMLAARRRLLLTLLALQVGAIGLSASGLAAPWVLVPPTIMLGIYLLLLREAAHADAERRAREAEASAARTRAQARADSRTAQPRRTAPAAPAPPPPPAEEDYSDLGGGRDYAPGLAGKYEPSGAESDDDVIDFARYKRAVGE